MGRDVHEEGVFGTAWDRGIWVIGGKDGFGRDIQNPYLGCDVKVTWKRKWGGHEIGFAVTGTLKATFAVNGRTLIGEVEVQGPYGKKTVSCPWSRNYIEVGLPDCEPTPLVNEYLS
jgi:hypothetical protein